MQLLAKCVLFQRKVFASNLVDSNQYSKVGVKETLDDVTKELEDANELLILDDDACSIFTDTKVSLVYEKLQGLHHSLLSDLIIA